MNTGQMQLANEKAKKLAQHMEYKKWYAKHGVICVLKQTKTRFDLFAVKMDKTYDDMINEMMDCYQNAKRQEYHNEITKTVGDKK